MYSMTGYGKGRAEKDGTSISIELSCVNRKLLDARLSLPRELAFLEAPLRSELQARISRGAVNLLLNYELAVSERRQLVQVDTDLLSALVQDLRETAVQLGLRADFEVTGLLNMPGVVREKANSLDPELFRELALVALARAVCELRSNQMREGGALAADLETRLGLLREIMRRLQETRQQALLEYRERLRLRLRELQVELSVDDDRLVRELAFAAEKADVSEELVRLEEHLSRLSGLLAVEAASGRELDFICQEMSREIGTLSAKVRDTAAAMLALDFKAELGRVREQVQNIE